MASSSENKKKSFPNGSITELFCFRPSSFVLMDNDENQTVRLIGVGQFVVYLMMHTMHPIFITVCSIDGFHFPLTKDTVIFRMAKRTFAVALPGLLYGIQFPHFCEEALMDKLESVFIKFAHYCKVVDEKELDYSLTDTDGLLWYKLRRRVEPMAREILSKLGQLPGKSRFSIRKFNSSYLRAIRMSATTKVIEDGMINSGTLTDSHFVVAGINPPHQPNDIISQNTAFASVSVFTCVVDSLEAEELTKGGLSYMVHIVEPPLPDGLPKLQGFKVWKLNEKGLADFIDNLGPAVEEEEETVKEMEEKWKVKNKEFEDANAASAPVVAPNDKGKSVKP